MCNIYFCQVDKKMRAFETEGLVSRVPTPPADRSYYAGTPLCQHASDLRRIQRRYRLVAVEGQVSRSSGGFAGLVHVDRRSYRTECHGINSILSSRFRIRRFVSFFLTTFC